MDLADAERCPRCGFDYGWDGSRCKHCGHPGGKCPECSFDLLNGVCIECGYPEEAAQQRIAAGKARERDIRERASKRQARLVAVVVAAVCVMPFVVRSTVDRYCHEVVTTISWPSGHTDLVSPRGILTLTSDEYSEWLDPNPGLFDRLLGRVLGIDDDCECGTWSENPYIENDWRSLPPGERARVLEDIESWRDYEEFLHDQPGPDPWDRVP